MADEDTAPPVMVKATFADGTVFYYDAARHAHPTHMDGSPLVSLVAADPGEEQRFEKPAGPVAVPAEPPAAGDREQMIAELEAQLAGLRQAAEQG